MFETVDEVERQEKNGLQPAGTKFQPKMGGEKVFYHPSIAFSESKPQVRKLMKIKNCFQCKSFHYFIFKKI